MNVLSIGFYRNSRAHLNALKKTGWCDTFYVEPNNKIGGIPGDIYDLDLYKFLHN